VAAFLKRSIAAAKLGSVGTLLAEFVPAKCTRSFTFHARFSGAVVFRTSRAEARFLRKRGQWLGSSFWFVRRGQRRLELHRGSLFFAQSCFDVTLGRLCCASGRADRRFRGGAGSAMNGRAELFDFFRQQIAMLARMNVQREGAITDALELLYMVPGLLKHRADLAVTPLDERDLVPGIL